MKNTSTTSMFSRSSVTGLAAVALLAASPACDREPPPGAGPSRASSVAVQSGRPELPRELSPAPSAAAPSPAPTPTALSAPPSPPADYKGTWFAVTSLSAGVYTEPRFEATKVGYIRNGGRVAVETEPVSRKNCTRGWYQLLSGGFVCGNLGTTDLAHPEVKFATHPPNLDEVLPYVYARNAKNGTPLYRSVPSREQMERYEPYLVAKPKEEPKPASDAVSGASRSAPAAAPNAAANASPNAAVTAAATTAPSPTAEQPIATTPGVGAALADGGLVTAAASQDPAPEQPWWQREDAKDRLHEVKLEQLEADADDVLAKRMVSGFYVAVDKRFSWAGRAWYKTTKGLIAPSDRFWQTAGSKFKGVELDGTNFKLPMAWVYGGRKSAGTFEIDPSTKQLKNAKTFERFEPIPLAGERLELGKTAYQKLADGTWVKQAHVRITQPGPIPADLTPGERWIDVNLKSQTLVAFIGDKPVYATLISSGKESKDKEKDHRTPLGEWRIREKHITTTMDGDGSAAGDLPYSIEDVPYVMYYHRSFALHGAFWHSNYGMQMSHGCVNLSPLDAKFLFYFATPMIPAGFHGVWSTDKELGTRVIVHE
jgi:lipoprotein-anchoring transpeptidase ErfK/SrfK